MFWNHSIEGQKVAFNGVPFIVSSIRKQHCRFGRQYFKQRSAISGRTHVQGTRKIGCPAHVHIHELTLFPSFSAPSEPGMCSLGSRKLKQIKAKKVTELKESLAMGKKLETVTKYFILLPTVEAHQKYHPTSGPAGIALKVHPKIIDKINTLVGEGITDVHEVKRALRHHVMHVLFPDTSNRPSDTNRAYYPTNTDIKNHIYTAKRAQQLSKLDQDNLKLKIDQWKTESSSSLFYYRPYKEIETKDEDHSVSDEYPDTFSQTLLYVHQEKWQQHLLHRYGNAIVLMDATYKTTKYELPMFFVTVKTNVGYTPIADFIVQSETADKIAEALRIIASWNPQWSPPHFMTDYSDAEITAIESVFPQCKVYLCDFHREQCWERWIKDRKHGLSPSDGDILLEKLRKIASAAPGLDGSSTDCNYQKAVEELKKTEIWKRNQQVQQWLNLKWLPVPQVSTCAI